MTSSPAQEISCTLKGEEKLPTGIGGEAGVCGSIARAALPALQRSGIAPAKVEVEVRVASQYAISAVASVNGRALPEQKVGISDRPLNARAVDMLAAAIAGELAKLGGKPGLE